MERSPKQDFWWRRGSSKGRVALALKTLQFFDKDHLTIIEKSMVNDSIVLLNKIINNWETSNNVFKDADISS